MGTRAQANLAKSQVSMMRNYAVAAVGAALILLAGCGSSATTSQTSTSVTPPAQTSTPTTTPTQSTGQVYRIGESFVLPGSNNTGTFQLTVDGISNTVDPTVTQDLNKTYGSFDTKPDPGMARVIVEIHGTNTGNQPAFFLTQFFVLTAGGKQFDVRIGSMKDSYISQAYSELRGGSQLSATSNPGETSYEWVVFEVPSGLPAQSILISADGPSNGPSATIDLTQH